MATKESPPCRRSGERWESVMICDKTHNLGEKCVDRFDAYNYIKDNSEPVDNRLALTT